MCTCTYIYVHCKCTCTVKLTCSCELSYTLILQSPIGWKRASPKQRSEKYHHHLEVVDVINVGIILLNHPLPLPPMDKQEN